jgi:hypothetical protein
MKEDLTYLEDLSAFTAERRKREIGIRKVR